MGENSLCGQSLLRPRMLHFRRVRVEFAALWSEWLHIVRLRTIAPNMRIITWRLLVVSAVAVVAVVV